MSYGTQGLGRARGRRVAVGYPTQYSIGNASGAPANQAPVASNVTIGLVSWDDFVDETVSGGAVAELSSGTISLTTDRLYYFEAHIINNDGGGPQVFQIGINGNTTSGDYRKGLAYSGGGRSDSSAWLITQAATSAQSFVSGFISETSSGLATVTLIANSQNTSDRLRAQAAHLTGASSITELFIRDDVGGSNLANNSRLIIKAVE